VNAILFNVCPNCGGGFEKRPSRPKEKLQKSPAGTKPFLNPVQLLKFTPLLVKNKNIKPNDR